MKQSKILALIYILFTQCAAYCAAQNAPISIKHTMFKFAMAMAGVIVSSVVIFGGLSLYNKLRGKHGIASSDYANSLESPKTIKDAINLFLEKTKWD